MPRLIDLPFRYGLLDPRVEEALPLEIREAAEQQNGPLLGAGTLGIEVTVPALARRCGLGNIDPQHGPTDDARAAIDVCLETPPPIVGSALVTVRPDLDALGSMALLTLLGRGEALSADGLARVAAISTADRFVRGPWPGPRPLPTTIDDFGDESPLGAVAALASDRSRDLEARVVGLAAWLSEGTEPAYHRADVRSLRRKTLVRLERGLDMVELAAGGCIAVVRAQSAAALQLGYCLAPVVVAENMAFGTPSHRKLTIAQYDAGHVDLRAVTAELCRLESGWGGSVTIAGSPQGRSSSLPLDLVIEIVERYLRVTSARTVAN